MDKINNVVSTFTINRIFSEFDKNLNSINSNLIKPSFFSKDFTILTKDTIFLSNLEFDYLVKIISSTEYYNEDLSGFENSRIRMKLYSYFSFLSSIGKDIKEGVFNENVNKK